MSAETPFSGLAPEVVLQAVEQMGLRADGRLLALNSYENRVYRVGLDADSPLIVPPAAIGNAVVVKFYRAGRWTDAQIREEHAFAAELAAAELPVAAPLRFDGESLHRIAAHRFALFECWPGTAPELDAARHRAMLGRALGRMHALGATRAFQHRSTVRDWRSGNRARDAILNLGIIPAPIDVRYAEVSAQLTAAVSRRDPDFAAARSLRLHGDCHPGNILWNDRGPLFVDFDDCLSGPAVQDLWMLSAGTVAQQRQEWAQLMEGYERFAHFDFAEVALIESLRAIRMLNHAAWLATRWADPAFPRAFPWFAEPRFWERHVAELQEQLEAVEDPPLLRATW